ncbi:MAG: OmpH family outer membrane protein [Caulobacterales bacterium]
MRFLKYMALAAGLALAVPAPAAHAQRAGSVIVMDYERVLTTSTAGRDVETKLRQIAEQMQAELRPEQTAVQTEATSLRSATQGMNAQQIERNSALNTRVQALNRRAETLRTQEVTRARDLEYTRQQALLEFNRQLQPIVTDVMNSARASVVIDRSNAQIVGDGVDATDQIVSRLNQRVQTINVTRRAAPTQQQAPAANQ